MRPALRKLPILIIAAALLRAGAASACSQCLCGGPTPAGFLLSPPGSRWSATLEDLYISKTAALGEEPGEERQSEHRVSAMAAFRPSERWLLRLRIPYVFKSNTRLRVEGAGETSESRGVGDAELLARFDLVSFSGLFERRGALALTGAVTAPTGSNEVRDAAGDRLDAHLQPGTGAWAWTSGLVFDHRAFSGAVSASVLARVQGRSPHGYRYGNTVLFNAGYARALGARWQAAAEIHGRVAGFDRAEDGALDSNTGGGCAYFSPGLRWLGFAPMILDAALQLPILRSLNGVQQERATARFGLTWAF